MANITITRRDLLSLSGSAALAAAWPGASPGAWDRASQRRRPNIIFILADDLGYGDLGCYGQQKIRTPHIDALASQGARFTQAYAGSTVCAPSRCCLMTGLHTGHCFIRGNARHALRPGDLTVAEVLKQAGYATAHVGKWGLGGERSTGLPTKKGFDYFYGYLDQQHAHNSWPSFLIRNEQRVRLRNVVPKEDAYGAGAASVKADFSNDLMADEALAFIERSKDRPFFLYYCPTIPHANNEARTIDVPDLGIYAVTDWPEPLKLYAAAITRLDDYVGRIMSHLRLLGIDSNTIVFFSSDNGPHREGGYDPGLAKSSGPLRGIKRDLYEGGIRVPMIVRWPGRIAPRTVSDLVWTFWDFLPTAAELAGLPVPAGLDGVSVLPGILGLAQPKQHEFLYWEFHEGGFHQAVRMGNFKAVRHGSSRPLELYDLTTDPGETRNIASDQPQIVATIEAYLARARTESREFPIKEPQTRPVPAAGAPARK